MHRCLIYIHAITSNPFEGGLLTFTAKHIIRCPPPLARNSHAQQKTHAPQPGIHPKTSIRPDDPCSDFSYDDLDRLTLAAYGIDDTNELFTMDDLGNRTTVNVRDGNDVNYVVDNLTNRYNSVGDANLSYDSAGNLTADKDGCEYQYDYENRIVKITKDGNDIAEFAYDCLGRRIRKIDSVAGTTTLYYYNDNWQVLCEYNGSDVLQRAFIYGNYIDEVLCKFGGLFVFYVHDHLYSPVALLQIGSPPTVGERYEYDAYGSPYILEPNFAADPDGKSDYGNPYYFQGKRLDLLDGGGLELMSWPYRDYSTYLGRWLQAEKLGVIPNDAAKINRFAALKQYIDGINGYEFVRSSPANRRDRYGTQGEGEEAPPWIPLPELPDPAEFPVPAGTASDCGYFVYCDKIDVDNWEEEILAWLGVPHCEIANFAGGMPKSGITYDVMVVDSPNRTLRSGSGKDCPCECATCERIDSCVEEVRERVPWGQFYPNCFTQTKSIIKDCCLISNWRAPSIAGPAM